MTLHISGNVEQAGNEVSSLHTIGSPLSIIEQHTHQPLRMTFLEQLVFQLMTYTTGALANTVKELRPRLVQVVLQRLAYIVMKLSRGIGCSNFFTLSHHREDTADNHGRTGINR